MRYDVLVLGCGPAGFYSALSCAARGFKTAVVEKGVPGGTGLGTGCLPVKLMMDRIKLLRQTGDGPDLSPVLSEYSSGMEKLRPLILRRLKDAGVELYLGEGRFLSPHSFRIGQKELSAATIILATGSEAASLPGLSEHPRIISHKEAVSLSRAPETLTIVGGDVEGIEFASLFSELGSSVEVIEQQNEILPGYDRDLVSPLEERLLDRGVRFTLNSRVIKTVPSGDGIALEMAASDSQSDSPGPRALGGSLLVTGIRRPCIPEGLEAAGVDCLGDRIPVDENLRSNAAHIYALGDLNGLLGMGSAAVQQGLQMGDHLKERIPISLDQGGLPRAVFSLPEIAGAGMQEKELAAGGIPYRRGRFSFSQTWRGLGREDKGFIKVLAGEDDRVAGIWMSGHSVSDTAGFCAPLLNAGIRTGELKRSLMIHPVMGEALLEACNRMEWE